MYDATFTSSAAYCVWVCFEEYPLIIEVRLLREHCQPKHCHCTVGSAPPAVIINFIVLVMVVAKLTLL